MAPIWTPPNFESIILAPKARLIGTDISAILPHEEGIVGQVLNALFGYTSQPEVATFVVWLSYVVVVLSLYLRPIKRPPAGVTTGSTAPIRS